MSVHQVLSLYTHLTLPATPYVYVPGVLGTLKQKNTTKLLKEVVVKILA
ncbi:hypothetical protein HmCmsJML029_03106 [Escherichia coli]|nr:hypothetical protein HmCmsJML029_03106 [Escherichia coli]